MRMLVDHCPTLLIDSVQSRKLNCVVWWQEHLKVWWVKLVAWTVTLAHFDCGHFSTSLLNGLVGGGWCSSPRFTTIHPAALLVSALQ